MLDIIYLNMYNMFNMSQYDHLRYSFSETPQATILKVVWCCSNWTI